MPNVQASGGGKPVSETPIVVNPVNSKQLLTGAMDYNCGRSLQSFWASSDGGTTWSGGCAPLVKGANGGEGDPVVGYDLNGTAWRGGVDVTRSGQSEIAVSSSTDNGASWSAPVVAVKLPKLQSDKPWLEIDTGANSPDKNTIYISSTQFDSENNSQIYVTHSSDGGQTWQSVAVSTQDVWPLVNQFSDLAIGADGTVYLSYMSCSATGIANDCGDRAGQLYFAKSNDGGNTWSTPVLMASTGLAFDQCGCAFFRQPAQRLRSAEPDTCYRRRQQQRSACGRIVLHRLYLYGPLHAAAARDIDRWRQHMESACSRGAQVRPE